MSLRRSPILFTILFITLLPMAAIAGGWTPVDEGLDTRFSMELEASKLQPGAVTKVSIGFQVEDGWYVEGPTFNKEKPIVEAYLFDFDNDIYNKNIELFLYKQIRQEKKFNGIKELLNQINLDIAEAKKILNYGN